MEVGKLKLAGRLIGHAPKAGSVYGVVFHPQGEWLASAGADKQIILWTLPAAADQPAVWLRSCATPDIVDALTVKPDGSLIASGGNDTDILLWDPQNCRRVGTLHGHAEWISESGGLAFSPDGSRLVSASYDGTALL